MCECECGNGRHAFLSLRTRPPADGPAAADRRGRVARPRRRRRPTTPLFWEVSVGDAEGWAPVDVLLDSTGGFNYGAGVVELQIGPRHTAMEVGGKRAHWVRSPRPVTRAGLDAPPYAHPPEIYALTAAALGALVHAERRAGRRGGPRRQRRHAGPGVRAPPPPDPPRRGGRGAARAGARVQRAGRPGSGSSPSWRAARAIATTCSTRPPAPSSSAPRSAAPTAAGGGQGAIPRRAPRCASRPTAKAAGAWATSRPAR